MCMPISNYTHAGRESPASLASVPREAELRALHRALTDYDRQVAFAPLNFRTRRYAFPTRCKNRPPSEAVCGDGSGSALPHAGSGRPLPTRRRPELLQPPQPLGLAVSTIAARTARRPALFPQLLPIPDPRRHLVRQRDSELMRQHTHLPAVVGFVRKHVAQHFQANRPRPSPAVSAKLLDAAFTTAQRLSEHLRAASGALGQSRTGLLRRAVRAIELRWNLQVRSGKPEFISGEHPSDTPSFMPFIGSTNSRRPLRRSAPNYGRLPNCQPEMPFARSAAAVSKGVPQGGLTAASRAESAPRADDGARAIRKEHGRRKRGIRKKRIRI